MNFTISDAPQKSDQWRKDRLGRVTGSKAATLFMGKETAGRRDYIMQLALERITGCMEEDGYVSSEMKRGSEIEYLARIAIEAQFGVFIRETGFIKHHDLMIGVSLDGDSDDFDCVYEFKCPKSTTHIGYIEEGVLPKQYRSQVMHEMYVTGSQRCVFCSFDNRMPKELQLFSIEVKAQDLPMEEYEKALNEFLDDVSSKEQKLMDLMKRGEK